MLDEALARRFFMSDSSPLEVAKQGLQALIVARANADGWLRGRTQNMITDLLFGYEGEHRRTNAGWIPKAVKALRDSDLIAVDVDPATGINKYRSLAELDEDARCRCTAYISSREAAYEEAIVAEADAKRKRELRWHEDSMRRAEAERLALETAARDRHREEARLQAERDQLEAAREEMCGRLTEINEASKRLFDITIDEVTPVSNYPAMRAKFVVTVAGIATIRKCSFFERASRVNIGPPAVKFGSQWVSDVEFASDVSAWLARAMKYVLDAGIPPIEAMKPPGHWGKDAS